jgi:hypothetical protein
MVKMQLYQNIVKNSKILIEDIISDLPFNIENKSLPVRAWTKQRSLPMELKIEKYKTSTVNRYGLAISIKRYSIWGRMETVARYKNRKRQKRSKRWCKGSNKSSRRSFEWKIKKGYVWIKLVSKWNSIDVKGRKMYFDGKYLRLELKPDEIGIWYTSGEGQIRCLIFPREIKLGEGLFELIGILDGEICKKINKNGGTSVKISNAEPTIVRHIINEFQDSFNISKEKWCASITINAKGFNPSKEFCNDIKEFWSKESGIPIERVGKTTITKKYYSRFSPMGIIQIRYSVTMFWQVIMELLKRTRSITISDKRSIIPYIRGLVAAEGGIGKNKSGTLRFIGIGGTKREDREFYSRCLKKLGIDSIGNYNLRIEIYGKKNLKKFKELKLFDLHPERKKGFNKAFCNYKN